MLNPDLQKSDLFTRHRGPVTGVAGVANSDLVVTSAYDAGVGLFDLARGEASLLGYHNHLVNSVTVDPKGRLAASSSSDYTIKLWDLNAKVEHKTLLGHWDDVEAFVFLDEKRGASASRDWRILVWDLETGAISHVLEGHEKDVLAIASDGRHLYSSGDDMTLRVWDLETGRQVSMWGPFEMETDSCAIDTANSRVVLGCDDGAIRIFDTATGEAVQTMAAHGSGIKKVAVSPATGDILSAAYDQRLLVWDRETFEVKLELEKLPSTWERSLTWSPDGTQILGGTFDGTVLAWDIETGKLLQEAGAIGTPPGNPCFNDVAYVGDRMVCTVSDDGFVRLGDLSASEATWRQSVEPSIGRMLMNGCDANLEQGVVAAGTHDQQLHLYDFQNGSISNERTTAIADGPINSVKVSNVAGYEGDVFVGSYGGSITRVRKSGEIAGRIDVHDGAVKSLCLHPSKEIGVSCGADGILRAWNYQGEVTQEFPRNPSIINDIDMSPSGGVIATVGRDFVLKLFDLETGRTIEMIELGRRSLKSVCFWDDATVFVGDYWGTVFKVDLTTNDVSRMEIAKNGISSISRGESAIVTASFDGTIRLCNPESFQEINRLTAMTQVLVDGTAAVAAQ